MTIVQLFESIEAARLAQGEKDPRRDTLQVHITRIPDSREGKAESDAWTYQFRVMPAGVRLLDLGAEGLATARTVELASVVAGEAIAETLKVERDKLATELARNEEALRRLGVDSK